MIEPEYREEMRVFYRRLADFMSERPELFGYSADTVHSFRSTLSS
jgi:hypothetical protein